MYTLSLFIFKHPDGIAFTPWCDLIISNEAGGNYGTAHLLIFKKRNPI